MVNLSKKKTEEFMSLSEKLLGLQVSTIKPFGRWLTAHLSFAIEHLPTKEEFIFKVFRTCVGLLFLLKKKTPLLKKTVLSTLASLPRSKWTTFLDKLTSSNNTTNHVTLATELLQILLLESISREKVFRPFWTPACKDASVKLSLPTETDFVALASNSCINWSQKQEVKSPFLTIKSTELVNKSSPTILSPSSTFFPVAKWEKEAIPVAKLKTFKLKILPTLHQKKLLDRFIHTSRYVYNKTIEMTSRHGHKPNYYDLRDLLVTEKTKKRHDSYKGYDSSLLELRLEKKKHKDDANKVKLINDQIKAINTIRRNEMKEVSYANNPIIQPFELETPKDIRAAAVKRCCDAMKSGFSNLRNGNIKFFKMKYKKRSDRVHTIELTPKLISITTDGKIKIAPETFGKEDCYIQVDKHNIRKIKDLVIDHNVDLSKTANGYYIYLTVNTLPKKNEARRYVGAVDLGVRTLGTVYSKEINGENTILYEYEHRIDILRSLNKKIKFLKELRRDKLRMRKKHLNKREKKKRDLVDKLHWDFINDLLQKNDVVYIGDIKSHDIVKRCNNRTLNRDFNDLKFYLLKQRLLYKASVLDKRVFYIHEHYTTKGCSSCGQLNNHVGSSKVFQCVHCGLKAGRDHNASKNMLLKGMFNDAAPMTILEDIPN